MPILKRDSWRTDQNDAWTKGEEHLVEDRYPTYFLPYRKLMSYLRQTFGPNSFRVEMDGDQYILSLPRALSPGERTEISQMRYDESAAQCDSYDDDTPRVERSGIDSGRNSPNLRRDNVIKDIQSEARGFFIDAFVPQVKGKKGRRYVFGGDQNTQSSSTFLYRSNVSNGMTSGVYGVDASWNFISQGKPYGQSKEVKLAIKRLNREITLDRFMQEYETLKRVMSERHPNIVEFIQGFNLTDVATATYNLCFPLAAGNLKQLFYVRVSDPKAVPESTPVTTNLETHSFPTGFVECAQNNLWTEFKGLASAIKFLHDDCNIVHTDIKSSNILLYMQDKRHIVAKLTDFGLAVDLGTRATWSLGSPDSMSATQWDAPELREGLSDATRSIQAGNKISSQPKRYKANDIWKLGSVFTELLSFLVDGGDGVSNFRKYITTINRELKSDTIDDTRFDDGKKVKIEVINWLKTLSTKHVAAECMFPLIKQMLAIEQHRLQAAEVSAELERIARRVYKIDSRVTLIKSSDEVEPLSSVDSAKEWIEKKLKHHIDWTPFQNGRRSCAPGYSRLIWIYGSMSLHEDFPDSVVRTITASSSNRPIFQHGDWPGQTPVASSSSSSHTATASGAGQSRFAQNLQPYYNSSNNPNEPLLVMRQHKTKTSGKASKDEPKEIYWCVDRAWTEPKVTSLRTLSKVERFDDKTLCELLKDEYSKVRSWRGLFSWKSCQDVQFVQFSRWKSDPGQVFIVGQDSLPSSNQRPPYHYEIPPASPPEVHMRRVAKEIIAAMYHPERVANARDAINGVPKKLSGRSSQEDWGIYAVSKFSLWKVMVWVTGIAIAVCILVFSWILTINDADVHATLIALGLLGSMILMVLAVPQLLDLD